MKREWFVICMFAGLFTSGSSFAECPNNLPVDELVDCIVVEGAGGVHSKSVFKKTDETAKASPADSHAKQRDQLAQNNK